MPGLGLFVSPGVSPEPLVMWTFGLEIPVLEYMDNRVTGWKRTELRLEVMWSCEANET